MRRGNYSTIGNYLIAHKLKLGDGFQGHVCEGKIIHTNESVAIKFIPKQHKEIIEDRIKQLHDMELTILKKCKEANTPNIIQLIDHIETSSDFIIILELCEQSLAQYMLEIKREKGRITESQAIQWILQIVEGMRSLHQVGYCHRDLKPANILIKENQLKIIDLGFGKFVQQNDLLQSNLGTEGYMAPEIGSGHYSPFQADMYSLGVIFYEMIYGIMGQTKVFTFEGVIVSENTKNLIKSMLKVNSKERINWFQLNLHIQERLVPAEQQNVAERIRESTIFYQEKQQKDLNFLKSIIQECSLCRFESNIAPTPCLLLITKLIINQIDKQLLKLLPNETQFVSKITDLRDQKIFLFQYLKQYLKEMKKLYGDFSKIKIQISEMEPELVNECSDNFSKIYQNSIYYFFDYLINILSPSVGIRQVPKISSIALMLLIANDYESDFETIKSLLLNAGYTIQGDIIDYFVTQLKKWEVSDYNEFSQKECQKLISVLKEHLQLRKIE